MGHDTIRLSGLRLSGRHGVLDFEKRDAQPFLVDAELQVDLREAGRSDSLSQTISYAEAADIIERIVTGETYDLIEALAEAIAAALLSHDQRIQAVTVTVAQTPRAAEPGIRLRRGDRGPQPRRYSAGAHCGGELSARDRADPRAEPARRSNSSSLAGPSGDDEAVVHRATPNWP